MKSPFITIAMPCFDEERYIEACLERASSRRTIRRIARGPRWRTAEAPIAHARSWRGSPRSVRPSRVRMIDNPKRLQAAGMNEMLRESRGDVIIRMDVHARYAPDYVSSASRCSKRPAPTTWAAPSARSPKTCVPARALRPRSRAPSASAAPVSLGGSGGLRRHGLPRSVSPAASSRRSGRTIRARSRTKMPSSTSASCGRAASVYPQRDDRRSLLTRATRSERSRSSISNTGGGARARCSSTASFPALRPAIPFLMTMAGAALVATLPVQPFTPFLFGAYAAATGVEAIRVGHKAGALAIPIVWAIFPVLHVSHGLGFAAGLVRYATRPDWPERPHRLAPRAETQAARA